MVARPVVQDWTVETRGLAQVADRLGLHSETLSLPTFRMLRLQLCATVSGWSGAGDGTQGFMHALLALSAELHPQPGFFFFFL